jgi:hypothetical protein
MSFLIAIYLLFHKPNYYVPKFTTSAKGEIVEVVEEDEGYSSKADIYSSKESFIESDKDALDPIMDTPDVLNRLMEFPTYPPIRTSCPIPIRDLDPVTQVNHKSRK